MEVEIRIVRAHLLLSLTELAREDGIVSLLRSDDVERLGYASISRDAPPKKNVVQTLLRWKDQQTDPTLKLTIPMDMNELVQSYDEEEDENQCPLPKVECLLFLLSHKSETTSDRPKISLLTRATLQLTAQDLNEVNESCEVVFRATLEDGLGEIELKIRMQNKLDDRVASFDPPSGFQVQYSSREAFEDNQRKQAQNREKMEAALLKRLRSVEAKAAKYLELRDEAVYMLRKMHAARNIQRSYRTALRKRQEMQERLQRAKAAIKVANRLRAKETVVQRNRDRAQAMRERIRRVQENHQAVYAFQTAHRELRHCRPMQLGVWKPRKYPSLQVEAGSDQQQLLATDYYNNRRGADPDVPLKQDIQENYIDLDPALVQAIRVLHLNDQDTF